MLTNYRLRSWGIRIVCKYGLLGANVSTTGIADNCILPNIFIVSILIVMF